MAQGIQLAGGFGAGGVKDALVDLIAQRMAQQEFEEKRRQAANAETLARETLGQRKTEATAEDLRAKASLRENQRQFGENLGLNVKKLGEDTRQFDVSTGENRRQFDTGLSFKQREAQREQGNTERGFGLKERQLTEEERANRAGEGIARGRMAGGANAKSPEQLDALADMVLKDPEVLKNLPPTDRSRVLAHIGTSKEGGLPNKRAESTRAMLESTAETIKQLKTMKGRAGAIGAPSLTDPGSWTRLIGREPMAGSDAANYAAYVDKLKSQLTLPRMEMLRGLGAMSDREFKTLADSATALGSNLGEGQFETELGNVESAINAMRQRLGAGGADGGGGGSPGVGDVVSIGGKRVRIAKIHPDGTFDGSEVP